LGHQIEDNEVGGTHDTHGRQKQAHTGFFEGKPELKRTLGRPRNRRKDDIKMNLHEVGWDKIQIDLARNRSRWASVVNVVMNIVFPYSSGNFLPEEL
jgi:hypothetical protein